MIVQSHGMLDQLFQPTENICLTAGCWPLDSWLGISLWTSVNLTGNTLDSFTFWHAIVVGEQLPVAIGGMAAESWAVAPWIRQRLELGCIAEKMEKRNPDGDPPP